MLAVHLDNLFFLILVVTISLLRLLAKAGGSKKTRPDREEFPEIPRPTAPSPYQPPPGVETDEDRIRKFLEALGQSPTAKPPPPVAPRTDVPPRPLAPVQPPPAMFPRTTILTAEPKRRRVVQPEAAPAFEKSGRRVFVPKAEPPALPVEASKPTPVESTPASVLTQAYEVPSQKTEIARVDKNILLLLQSPNGLRNAIVLREILGPPRSLQPLELIG